MGISANGKKFMDNSYNYDAIGNILGISNSATPDGDIGGSTSHSYSYDELNRLVQAQGSYTGSKSSSNYTLSMQYDIMGNILRKTQNHVTDGTQQMGTSHDLVYKYEGSKPNAASKIGDCLYTYDENGNLTFREDTITNNYRQLWWDEENRLMMLSDDGYVNNYLYDAGGERVVKSHGGSQGVYINGAPIGVINHSDANYTVYVSPYFTMDANKFTKHYYAGSTRVSSKIGNGRFENQFRSGVFEITAGSVNYIARQQNLKQGYQNYIQNLGIPPGPPTMKGINGDPYNSGKAINPVNDVNTKVPSGWPGQIVFAPPGGPPGAPIQYGDSITNNTAEAGFGYLGSGNVEEDLRYFFHSDHLGSTSYITNAKGEITQFVGYMPFGESFVEQHTDYDSPYKFNGKEMDSETGLCYYGARFYDPQIGRWMSVDPHAEKYNQLTPYNYVYNNPLIYIDPTGKDGIITIDKGNHTIVISMNVYYHVGRNYTTVDQDYVEKIESSVNKGGWNSIKKVNMGDDNHPDNWTVSHRTKFVGVEAGSKSEFEGKVNKILKKDKSGNILKTFSDSKKGAFGAYYTASDKSFNINLAKENRDLFETFNHELGHGFGLPDATFIPDHPAYGDQTNARNEANGGIMTYAISRSVYPFEAKTQLTPALKLAKEQSTNVVKIHQKGFQTGLPSSVELIKE